MNRTLLLSVAPGEIWAALAQDEELIGLRLERSGALPVGAVFLGRVVALRPDLPAALVDIGLERPAFLDARDADRQRGIAGLTEGQAVIVELRKAARADKAAGVRVLRTNDPRHAALVAAAGSQTPPVRLDRAEAAIIRAALPFLACALARIVVDDRAAYAELRGFLRRAYPQLEPALALHDEALPLFAAEGLDDAVAEALAPQVALPGGGTLHLEPTHGATIIDVDSGGRATLPANLEAARVAARQIALRGIAGPIVIDFIGMKKSADRDAVTAALREGFAGQAFSGVADAPEILGWTRLGHFELARARREAALAEILLERAADGTLRRTALTIALDALRRIAQAAKAEPARRFAIAAHPDIAAALDAGEGLAARQWLEARLGRSLAVTADPRRAREAVDIEPA